LFAALLFVLSSTANFTFAQEKILVLSASNEYEIKGGEIHPFTVQLAENQTAKIEIIQKGIDVSLAAYKPNGERFIESESPSGFLGNDSIFVTAKEAGNYKVEVTPADPRSPKAKYEIKLAEIRATTEKDFEINEATKKILELANETVGLRQTGTRENRRKVIQNFAQIYELSKVKQDRAWEIVALITSGIIYEQLGELQKALEFYLKGLAASREVENGQYEGSAVNNIGYIHSLTGNYENAINYYERSLVLEREVKNVRGEAISLNNVGTAYLFLNNIPKALENFEKSLVLRRQVKDERGEGNTLNNLGLIYEKAGDLQKSLDYLQQAFELRKRIGDKRGEANSLRNLGKTFYSLKDGEKAFEYFTKANDQARLLGERRIEADSFYWLATIENERGNLQKAFENIEKGLLLIEQTRGELLSPDLRISYFSTVQAFYELYTEIYVSLYEKTNDEKNIFAALETSEKTRTRNLVELLQEARIDIKQGIDEKTLEKFQDLQDGLNAKYRQRTQILSGKPTPEQISKINLEITTLSNELESFKQKIRQENPHYANLFQDTNISTQEIKELLDDETVLLEYKLGEKRSFLWLVTKDSVKFFQLPARKEIEKTARELYDSIVSRDKKTEAKTAELSKNLAQILKFPSVEIIKNKRIAIVADGLLQFIPFSALSETNEIVVLPSASVLTELRENSKTQISPKKTLGIFADPIFEANDPRFSQISKINEKNEEVKRILRDFRFGESLPRLLSSRVEARNISSFVPKNQVLVNVDFEANRENATKDELADYKILHFATHGLLDTAHPELSGLVLSLYDKNGKSQDGFLRLNQIYNLKLNSDLVVLSACQTALGKDVRGEGLIGLTRGFMYAGANRVVASLWKVDDAATAEFMKIFYQNLLQKNLKPSTALHAAKLEMKKIPRFRAPYFWAGFTIQGDWR
ncbi:MAG TPA: CHAT domain-containing protein, partial [Pyrinomonadaceae bacterium]|nr:CHAT domain-containing protein [Pyrinomonadaceae bacterium]